MSTEVALFYEQSGSKKSERWLSTEILFINTVDKYYNNTIELIFDNDKLYICAVDE